MGQTRNMLEAIRSARGDRPLGLSFLWLSGLVVVAAILYISLMAQNVSTASAQPGSVAALGPTASPSPTPTASPRASAVFKEQATDPTWPTMVPTGTITPAMQATPTASPLPSPSSPGILAIEGLWGTQQACSEPLADPENSIDLAFNDATASCGPFGNGSTWAYTAMEDTSFASIAQAILEIRFYVSGWSNDSLAIEANNGSGWQVVAVFDGSAPPPLSLQTRSYDLSAMFSTPAEVNAAQVRFIGEERGTPDDYSIHLDEARLSVFDAVPLPTPVPTLPPLPTPTLAPPSPTQIPGPDDPHVAYAATTASCAACHRTHTAPGRELRKAWPEESVCFACHSAGGPGTDVQTAFDSVTNTETAFFKHDVAATSGVHRSAEGDATDYSVSNRHVECEDCHEPHEATRAESSPPARQPEINWTSGVDPLWTAGGAPTGYSWLPQAEREYQVCFKCHSSFTSLPTYLPDGWNGTTYVADGLPKLTLSSPDQVPDSRDMAQEFNPYNASFHPVAAQGRNQSIPVGAFVPGWSSASLVYCSDCHSNPGPSGPHASPLLHLLLGGADYQTAASDSPQTTGAELCTACHDQEDYAGNGPDSNFRRGNRNLHGQHADDATCYLCHDSHGSEQLHLLNMDTSIIDGSRTYLLPGYDGQPTDSQSFWQISPDWTEKACWLACHGHDHTGSTYPNLTD